MLEGNMSIVYNLLDDYLKGRKIHETWNCWIT